MTKKMDSVLEEVSEKIKPSQEIIDFIELSLKNLKDKLNKNIKSSKIDAELFVGGSFAKKTMMKKNCYDVDIYVRFDKKYKNENLSKLTKKILKGIKDISVIHGSRDYFQVKFSSNFLIEVIPVLKVKNPKEAINISDLSYSHVKYINKKIKSNKILNDIKIAKAFCHANYCYGAESYVNGFSGYVLELLVSHYGGFLNFLKDITKSKGDKIIIDAEKFYKNKQEILMDINSSKLNSPIILIDPTYKQRNAAAALSIETFERFKKISKDFIKNPSINFFEQKTVDLEKIKKQAQDKKLEFILIEIKTSKQEGDIAGTKLLKFYKHLSLEISKYFEIKKKGFHYGGEKLAEFFFVAKRKKEILFDGPIISDEKNVKKFKKEHRNTFVKSKRIYAKEKISLGIDEFVKKWQIKNKRKLEEMYITNLNIK